MVMLQPPYSPDLATYYFFSFQKVKMALKGRHFDSAEYIQKSVTQVLKDISQNPLQERYKRLQQRWQRCV
jgi:hypothetical protein